LETNKPVSTKPSPAQFDELCQLSAPLEKQPSGSAHLKQLGKAIPCLADLRRRAERTGVKELLGQVQQYRRLVALGALEIDVTALPPAARRTT